MINRNSVEIINYNKKKEIESGIRVSELIESNDNGAAGPFIAAKVNNELTSLSYRLRLNAVIEFITRADRSGMKVYRRSLSFLLAKVVKRLFPDKRLIIGHSLGAGFYFDLEEMEVTAEIVKRIEVEMRAEVAADKPIIREKIGYEEALQHFKERGRDDKYKLLSSLNKSKITIYCCDDFFQLFDGAMAPSTGVLDTFSLSYYKPGFMLHFPHKSKPGEVAPFKQQEKLFAVYREYKNWGKILKVDNVGSLNDIIINKNFKNFIQVAEALHEKKIAGLAQEIYDKREKVKLVSIAGPSSSGKTTFSKKLEIQLQALGLRTVTISVDNYFIDRDKTPRHEDGSLNFEALEAINIELFNNHLSQLLAGKRVKTARYDFFSGKSSLDGEELTLGKDEILIIEGIHGLNEKLTYTIDGANKFKIYVSALTQMNIDDTNRIATTDNRIIRRLVRDYKYRGHSAKRTISMWPSVRKGEEEYIFPFQNEADGYFNSALDYELAVLKPYAETVLRQVKPSDAEYLEARRLLTFLNYFLPIPPDYIPSGSIIREFIGGSIFDY